MPDVERIDIPGGRVSIAFDGSPSAGTVVVLAPGAGGDMRGPFLDTVAQGLADAGLGVARFNFLYAEAGRRSPDRNDVLERTWRAVADEVALRRPEARLVLGGKSMGGRIASQVVAGGHPAQGLVLLGYPLHPPGRPERLRDAHLERIPVPMLFVEGTRDPFCPLETLRGVIAARGLHAHLVVIDDGDHSFKVRASSGRTTREAWSEVAVRVAAWVGRL